jgi:hypothetical protein
MSYICSSNDDSSDSSKEIYIEALLILLGVCHTVMLPEQDDEGNIMFIKHLLWWSCACSRCEESWSTHTRRPKSVTVNLWGKRGVVHEICSWITTESVCLVSFEPRRTNQASLQRCRYQVIFEDCLIIMISLDVIMEHLGKWCMFAFYL